MRQVPQWLREKLSFYVTADTAKYIFFRACVIARAFQGWASEQPEALGLGFFFTRGHGEVKPQVNVGTQIFGSANAAALVLMLGLSEWSKLEPPAEMKLWGEGFSTHQMMCGVTTSISTFLLAFDGSFDLLKGLGVDDISARSLGTMISALAAYSAGRYSAVRARDNASQSWRPKNNKALSTLFWISIALNIPVQLLTIFYFGANTLEAFTDDRRVIYPLAGAFSIANLYTTIPVMHAWGNYFVKLEEGTHRGTSYKDIVTSNKHWDCWAYLAIGLIVFIELMNFLSVISTAAVFHQVLGLVPVYADNQDNDIVFWGTIAIALLAGAVNAFQMEPFRIDLIKKFMSTVLEKPLCSHYQQIEKESPSSGTSELAAGSEEEGECTALIGKDKTTTPIFTGALNNPAPEKEFKNVNYGSVNA